VSHTQITIETVDGTMPSYEARPNEEARGGILVIQEGFGVTSCVEDVARRLSEVGWYALAPAFFHRQGSPVLAYDDLDSAKPIMGHLTGEGLAVDVSAAFDHLGWSGFAPTQIGVVGFCMGGSVTFYAATTRAVGAAVTFYGGGILQGRFGLPSLVDLAPALQTPWLGLYGDLDKGIPSPDVEQLRSALDKVLVPTEIVRYPDADHGFNCNDRPAVFNPTVATDAWQRTLAWFDSHLQLGHPAQ
jgi:carboxymethylenebutenolidase